MAEPEPLVEPEPLAEPETIPNAVDGDDGYDLIATFLPSVILATLILGGAVCSHLAAHWDEVEILCYKKFGIDLQGKFKRQKTRHSRGSLLCPQGLESHLNLDSDDPGNLEVVLEDLEKFVASMQSTLMPLLKIVLPCTLAIVICPFLLINDRLFKDLFWSTADVNVNNALEVFLVPVSLLFALLFTVSFEAVLAKQSEVRILLNQEVNILYKCKALIHNISSSEGGREFAVRLEISRLILRQALDLTWQLRGNVDPPPWDSPGHLRGSPASSEQESDIPTPASQQVATALQKLVTKTATQTILNQHRSESWEERWDEKAEEMMKKVNQDYERRVWRLLPLVKKLVLSNSNVKNGNGDHSGAVVVDTIVLSKMAENIMEFGDTVAQRRAVTAQTLSAFQWGFMEALGFVAFVAVILIDATSPKFELAMCQVTAFCVALLTLVVADGDDPYHGFIKVKIGSLVTLVRHAAEDVAWMKYLRSQDDALQRKKKSTEIPHHVIESRVSQEEGIIVEETCVTLDPQ